jgi:hypothetical protein
VTGRWLQKAGVFGIGPEDGSLNMALDEMHVALVLLARTTTRRRQALVSLFCSLPCRRLWMRSTLCYNSYIFKVYLLIQSMLHVWIDQ